jgi:transcriptional regulator GlxA family with amidase domain
MVVERVVVMVVFDGMKLLDVAGPAQVFAEANRFGASYRLIIASVDGAGVTTTVGPRSRCRVASIRSNPRTPQWFPVATS